MPAKVQVRGSSHLSGRDVFVVYGDIIEGVVRGGMKLHVRLNAQLAIEVPVASVEFVDGTPTGSHVALATPIEDPVDLATWQSLDLADEILEVTDSDAHAARRKPRSPDAAGTIL